MTALRGHRCGGGAGAQSC